MIDLTKALYNQFEPKKRVPGRYNASELYGIVKGYVSAREYLRQEKPDTLSCFRMWQGRWKHSQVQELLGPLGYTIEPKVEFAYKDIILVGKADAIKENGMEIKTSNEVLDRAKDWHRFQAKLYCTMFQKETWQIVQPVVTKNRVGLKIIGRVERDDQWFQEQLETLYQFHLEVKKQHGMEKN